MLSTVYRRTNRGQIAILTRSTLPVEQVRLLMRFTGFTPLEFLTSDFREPEMARQMACELLDAGLIESVPDEAPLISAWGALDELVPA